MKQFFAVPLASCTRYAGVVKAVEEFEFLEESWPLLVVRWPHAEQSDEVMRAAFEKMASYTARKERYCILHDARSSPTLGAKHRRMGAEIGKRDAHLSERYCAGTALVFDSAIIRGAITAVNWLFSPPYPQKTFSTVEEARAWCEELLRRDRT